MNEENVSVDGQKPSQEEQVRNLEEQNVLIAADGIVGDDSNPSEPDTTGDVVTVLSQEEQIEAINQTIQQVNTDGIVGDDSDVPPVPLVDYLIFDELGEVTAYHKSIDSAWPEHTQKLDTELLSGASYEDISDFWRIPVQQLQYRKFKLIGVS